MNALAVLALANTLIVTVLVPVTVVLKVWEIKLVTTPVLVIAVPLLVLLVCMFGGLVALAVIVVAVFDQVATCVKSSLYANKLVIAVLMGL